jgi:hypothetical protein
LGSNTVAISTTIDTVCFNSSPETRIAIPKLYNEWDAYNESVPCYMDPKHHLEIAFENDGIDRTFITY